MDADTISYYDRHVAEIDDQAASMTKFYKRFLRHVAPGGKILDVGCGVGRASEYFAQNEYDVTAIDASLEMVRRTRSRLGPDALVCLMTFDEIGWRSSFDGIWSCASLIHVPRTSFPRVARQICHALRRDGAWYMSFKLGNAEWISNGRLFVDYTEETLRAALSGLPLTVSSIWISKDVRSDRSDVLWLNAIVKHQ